MQKLSIEQFILSAETTIRSAAEGSSVAVSTGDGRGVVIIDESEMEMYRQALALCTEHPEWVLTNN